MAVLLTPAKAETKLSVIVFPGVQNLPMFAAQAKGFFAKRDLSVDLKFTPNSNELRNGLAEGRYHIAHSAVDNAFALKDKANVDIAVVLGGDDSFNRLIVQPEINSIADIKGKTVAVDAVNTAYAFQLYEMLRQKGLNKGDYEVKPVGGTAQRLEAHDQGQDLRGRDDEPAVLDPRREGRASNRSTPRRMRSARIRDRRPSCCARGARPTRMRWSNICRAASRACAG